MRLKLARRTALSAGRSGASPEPKPWNLIPGTRSRVRIRPRVAASADQNGVVRKRLLVAAAIVALAPVGSGTGWTHSDATARPRESSLFSPAWSRDGTQVAWESGSRIWI